MTKSYLFLRLSVLIGLAVVSLHSQTQIDLRTQSKSVDFSGADSTKPAKSGASLPANCSVGEVFFKTDEPAGSNLYGCTSVDVWTLLSGEEAPVISVFGRTGTVTAASGDYSASQVGNTPAGSIAATNVQSAINELESEKAPVSHTHPGGEIDDGGAAATQALFSGGAGNAGFRAITDADVPNNITIDLATAATALAADPADCAAGEFASAIDAFGTLSCATPTGGGDVTGPATHSDSFVPQWDGVDTKQLKNGIAVASINTASALVQRDASGNFSAGTITAALSGNASTATALASNPTDCPGGQFATAIDASGNLACGVPPGGGDVLGPASNSDSFVPQWNGVNSKTLKNGLQAASTNTASALVQRDGSGNFAAGTITGGLSGNASTSTALAANPANCTGNQYPKGIGASGAAEGCTLLVDADIPSAITRDSEINVQGTANEITSSGTGPTPTMSIASTFDISGKSSTAPIKKGTTLPATCSVGQYFMDTDAAAGQNTYACTATNTWSLQGDGTGGGGGAPTGYSYLGLGTDATLSAERVFTPGDGLEGTDGGAGGTYTVAVDLHATGPGLAFTTGDLSLLRTCADNQILKWDTGTSSWACDTDNTGSGSGTPDGSDGSNQYQDGGNFKADNSVLNVMSFGCAANGSTDDSACFQAAINALPTNGGTVVCPTGNYQINSTVTTSKRGVVIQGTSFGGFSTSGGTLECDADIGVGLPCLELTGDGSAVRNITMRNDFADAKYQVVGIRLGPGANHSAVEYSSLQGFDVAIRIDSGSGGSDSSWHLMIKNVCRDNGHCILSDSSNKFGSFNLFGGECDVRATGQVCYEWTGGQVTIMGSKMDCTGALSAASCTFAYVKGWNSHIVGNTLERCGGPCIDIEDAGFGIQGEGNQVVANMINCKGDASTVGVRTANAGASGNNVTANRYQQCSTNFSDNGSNNLCFGVGCGNKTGTCASSTTLTVKEGIITGCS